MKKIPFNKQNLFGSEFEYIKDAYENGKVSGDGTYTKKCSAFIQDKFNIQKALLTTSCTHALELAALLIDLKDGDEVILPSYTFVSTVNAIVLRGAIPVFCDIRTDNLNIDETKIEELITERTKAIIPVHYAGVACEMDTIMAIAQQHSLWVIEDAAQGINATYKGKYLGGIGHFGTYSFHETKNYSMGEGGALLVNDNRFFERAEILREKGTNRSKFFRGEIDKYSWVDIGSSFLPSDINAAILWSQFEHLDEIQTKRKEIYEAYHTGLSDLHQQGKLKLPTINKFATSNYHLFHIILADMELRDNLMNYLKARNVHAVFHYVPLHEGDYYKENYGELSLPNTEELSRKLLRLPLYFTLSKEEVTFIIEQIIQFFEND